MDVACYGRVSTPDQDLTRQLTSTYEFATTQLEADPETTADPLVIADHVTDTADSPAEYGDVTIYVDKSTGTNVERTGYEDLMAAVSSGTHEAVVVHSVSRLSRSIRDLDRISERIVQENDTALHILSEGFDLHPDEDDPYQRAMFRLLGVFAELEAELAQQRTKEGLATRMASDEYHHGRPPLGFTKRNGKLVEEQNIDQVRTILDMVSKDAMSKRQAAAELDTSRRTIGRALKRPELYGIAESEEEASL